MSVADELQTLNDNILAAYTTVGDKGGTVPTNKNTNNLATAIDSIPSGSGPTPTPLDPQVVYQQTRPADWLPMPTPANNEIYLLVKVPVPNQEKDPGTPLAFLCQTSAGQYQVELGTVTNGAFVADSTYTELVNSNTKYTNYLYYADWTTSPMNDGSHQVMVKISSVSGDITSFDHVEYLQSGVWGSRYTLEARGHCESASKYDFGSSSEDGRSAISMRFCSLDSTNNITSFSNMFSYCYSLTAVPQLDTSSGTNFSQMFLSCFSLTAIPQLGTASGTNFSYMFSGCSSLTTIPALDTSLGTNFSGMFQNCPSLAAIPQLNTSSGTSFNNMFNQCNSLTAIPVLDTSSGTSFSSMFSDCVSLTTIPALDTSSGTNFGSMFNHCSSLTTIPQLDTSLGTSFGSMFQGCSSLITIPALDTSSGTDFNSMFNNCYSLSAIPQLDISLGTNFQSMFYQCYSLTAVPQLDTSSGTNFSQMFYQCRSLRYIDFVGYDFTSVTNANNRLTSTYTSGGSIMRIDNKFQMSTGGFTGVVMATPQGASSTNPFYILVEDEQTMIPLGANATTVFTTSAYAHVVVPDSMYATYAADTYWATLGTRLKKRSEVTLPAWYQ